MSLLFPVRIWTVVEEKNDTGRGISKLYLFAEPAIISMLGYRTFQVYSRITWIVYIARISFFLLFRLVFGYFFSFHFTCRGKLVPFCMSMQFPDVVLTIIRFHVRLARGRKPIRMYQNWVLGHRRVHVSCGATTSFPNL